MGVLDIIGAIIMLLVYIAAFSGESSSKSRSTSRSYTSPTYRYSQPYSQTHGPKRKSNYRNAPADYIDRKRSQFEAMKKTDFFRDWKKAEFDCQNGKCAYCQTNIELYSPDTQVDHIKPLCHYGTNEYDNLVLACKKCNYDLKQGNYTWTDAGGLTHVGWKRPEWIRENPVLARAKMAKERREAVTVSQNASDLNYIPF